MAGRFSDVDALEFVNAIGVAASFTPTVRFVVFSDSVIVAAEHSEVHPLLRAVNFMYGNWFSELVYVRGAFACGDFRWVDDPPSDKVFRGLPNLTYARVYGNGLVTAFGLEQKSGPGAVCFLTDGAAALFRDRESRSVLDGQTPMLCWATEKEAKIAAGYATSQLDRSERDSPAWRHAAATKHFWTSVIAQGKFVSDEFSIHHRKQTGA